MNTHGRTHSLLAAALAVLVVACTVAAFAPAFSAGFVDFDDVEKLVQNNSFRGLGSGDLAWMFSSTLMGHYQPLTWISFAIDYTLLGGRDPAAIQTGGLNPAPFHRTNILLHAAAGVVLFLLSSRLITLAAPAWRREAVLIGAAFAALVFAVHPLRAESVAWITERRDVLSLLLLLLAAYAYVRAAEPIAGGDPAPLRRGWYVAAVCFLALSLLSKAWGMSFFVLVLALDVYPLRRNAVLSWWTIFVQKIPFALLGIAAAGMAAHAQASVLAAKTLQEWPVSARIAQAIQGLVWYAQKTLAPADLSPLYELPDRISPVDARTLISALILAAALGAIWIFRRRAPGLIVAAVVYIVMLGPILGVFQSGDQFVADRYSYIACIGWAVLAGSALSWALHALAPVRRVLALVAAGVIVLTLGALTYAQTRIWDSSRSLWAHAAAVTPTANVLINFGAVLAREGEREAAIEQYRAAIALRPTDGRAWYMLAQSLEHLGDLPGAERAYAASIEHAELKYPAMVNLGTIYITRLNRVREGEELYLAAAQDALRLEARGFFAPGLPFMAAADVLRSRGEPDRAKEFYRRAARDPRFRGAAERAIAELGG